MSSLSLSHPRWLEIVFNHVPAGLLFSIARTGSFTVDLNASFLSNPQAVSPGVGLRGDKGQEVPVLASYAAYEGDLELDCTCQYC